MKYVGFLVMSCSVLDGASLSVALVFSSTSQRMLSTANRLSEPTPLQLWENSLTTAVMPCPSVCHSSDLYAYVSTVYYYYYYY